MKRAKLGACGGAIVLVSAIVQTGVAGASHVSCGQVITADTTLDSDVGPCPGDGIIVGTDNITLDLGGHTVFSAPPPPVGDPGERLGIRLDVRRGVHVRNGTVAGFGTGVRLLQGTSNSLEGVAVRDSETAGILIHSHQNVVVGSRIERNGGTGIILSAGVNTIERNIIGSNAGSGVVIGRGSLNIRTTGSVVRTNQISRNGGDGILGLQLSSSITIASNTVAGNRANGVHLEPYVSGYLVQTNYLSGNAADGVLVERSPGPWVRMAEVVGNVAFRNRVFDLADENPGCAFAPFSDGTQYSNVWAGNRFGTHNQPCVD